MDYDAVMLFIKNYPDAKSLDTSEAFGVTVAKSFTMMNEMIEKGLVYRRIMKSPTNGKKIYGYRAIPNFEEVADNGDGSMKKADVIRNLRRLVSRGKSWNAAMHLASHNEWRQANNVELIKPEEVFN